MKKTRDSIKAAKQQRITSHEDIFDKVFDDGEDIFENFFDDGDDIFEEVIDDGEDNWHDDLAECW